MNETQLMKLTNEELLGAFSNLLITYGKTNKQVSYSEAMAYKKEVLRRLNTLEAMLEQ